MGQLEEERNKKKKGNRVELDGMRAVMGGLDEVELIGFSIGVKVLLELKFLVDGSGGRE